MIDTFYSPQSINAVVEQAAEEVAMTSNQIAELTGKRHSDVMRAIRTMEPAWERVHGRKFALMFITNKIGNGAERKDPYYSTRFILNTP